MSNVTKETKQGEETHNHGGAGAERSKGNLKPGGDDKGKSGINGDDTGGSNSSQGEGNPDKEVKDNTKEKEVTNPKYKAGECWVEVDEHGLRKYHFRKEEGMHGPIFWRHDKS